MKIVLIFRFKVHLIDIQERRRQALKARAERQVTEKNDLLDAWDDEDDKQDIPSEVQERLLVRMKYVKQP